MERGCVARLMTFVDADVAGYAELQYGAAKGRDRLVILTTLGSGIGSALLWHGVLPNTELGHLEIDGHGAESRADISAREEYLCWEEWAVRPTASYRTLELELIDCALQCDHEDLATCPRFQEMLAGGVTRPQGSAQPLGFAEPHGGHE